MSAKWYQKATVQSALATGFFVLVAAIVSGIFLLKSNDRDISQITSSTPAADPLAGAVTSVQIERIDVEPSQPVVGDRIEFTVKVRNNTNRQFIDGWVLVGNEEGWGNRAELPTLEPSRATTAVVPIYSRRDNAERTLAGNPHVFTITVGSEYIPVVRVTHNLVVAERPVP